MRAIILAAGRGLRMRQPEDQQLPKCLLRFDEMTLLERHLLALRAVGVTEVVLGLGFRHELVEAELRRLDWQPRPQIVLNERFDLGSVLTLHTVAEPLTRGGQVLLMDADVLYHQDIMRALVAGGAPTNRLLLDRDFEEGDEPMKLCLRDGVPVELRKQLAADLRYDTIGESVGFFRFTHGAACRLAELVAGYAGSGRGNMLHEEAIRDMLMERGREFEVADVTGLPWIEIDFTEDVTRAIRDVLPHIAPAGRPAELAG